MNIDTGEIINKEKLDKILKNTPNPEETKHHYKPLSTELVDKLLKMNRAQRRQYYRDHKEEFVN